MGTPAMLGKGLIAAGILAGAGWFAAGAHLFDISGPRREPVRLAGPDRASTPPSDADRRGAIELLTIPVEGVRGNQLTDTFSQARAGGRPHDAIDIMAPVGTRVRAAAAGQLEKLLLSKAGGNTIYMRSSDRRTMFYYAHLDRYAAGLREGQHLRQGEVIGTVGFSGNADPAAPHLHFAVMLTDPARKWWESGRAINPYPMLVQERGRASRLQ